LEGELDYTPEKGRAFWYDLDRNTLYSDAFWAIAGQAEADQVQSVWRSVRSEGAYPEDFELWAQERADPWRRLGRLQREIIEAHFGDDEQSLARAFDDFGQGVLADSAPERAARNDSIHMMDGQTEAEVIGYHRWHASIRAIQMAGETDSWWDRLASQVGCAWGIQSLARPTQRRFPAAPNDPIDAAQVAAVRAAWMALAQDQLDRQYERTPDVTGYHPDPLNPA
jgi:hypothetical protein